MPRNRQSGFTLVELMVTVAVIAILAMMAAPSFADYIDRTRVRGAADQVISAIGNARVEAVKADLDVAVAFTGSDTSWCMGANSATAPTGGNPADPASACNCTVANACTVGGAPSVIEVGTFPDVAIGALPAGFTFDSKMGVIVPLGTRSVTLTSPRGKYDITVEVNALGQARQCTPATSPTIVGVDQC